jgi:hypothetical protein
MRVRYYAYQHVVSLVAFLAEAIKVFCTLLLSSQLFTGLNIHYYKKRT